MAITPLRNSASRWLRIARSSLISKAERPAGFGHQPVGGIEARQGEARLGFAGARRIGDIAQQGALAVADWAEAELRPGVRIEQGLLRGGRLGLLAPVLVGDVERHGQAARPADPHLLGAGPDDEIV